MPITIFELQLSIFFLLQGSTIPDEFKQLWKEDDETIDSTGHIFVSSMVPIQIAGKVNNKTKIMYQNYLCNSAFSVRPLRFWKVKESREYTQAEAARIRAEINNVQPFNLTPKISIKLHALFSMLDSKAVTGKE